MHESCHTYAWVMSHICMSHVTHMNESCHTYAWVMSHICMSHIALMNESRHTYKPVMLHYSWVMVYTLHFSYTVGTHRGWLRWVASLKSQVSFAKEPYKRDDILQKRPILWSSLLIVATPWDIITHKFSRMNVQMSHTRQISHMGWLRLVGSFIIRIHAWELRYDAYAWVMSHVCVSHTALIDTSRSQYTWVMSHWWLSHAPVFMSHGVCSTCKL